MTVHRATFYAHVQATYGNYAVDKVQSLKVIRVTQNKPERLERNTIAVKLTLEVPDEAFEAFSPSATISIPLGQVQKTMHVITETP